MLQPGVIVMVARDPASPSRLGRWAKRAGMVILRLLWGNTRLLAKLLLFVLQAIGEVFLIAFWPFTLYRIARALERGQGDGYKRYGKRRRFIPQARSRGRRYYEH